MPLKLNVGLNKKIGEANYGSRGASVNFEVELEANLVREPAELQEKIRYLFRLAKESVEAEMYGHGDEERSNNASPGNNAPNGEHRNGRRATKSQVRAIHAIAGRQGVDVARLVRNRFQVDQPEDLSIGQASELIDELKAPAGAASNAGGRR